MLALVARSVGQSSTKIKHYIKQPQETLVIKEAR
jgi:hypothetical protein